MNFSELDARLGQTLFRSSSSADIQIDKFLDQVVQMRAPEVDWGEIGGASLQTKLVLGGIFLAVMGACCAGIASYHDSYERFKAWCIASGYCH